MDELETDRLRLRQLGPMDLPAWGALNADPAVMEFFPAMLSRKESDAFAARIRVHWDEYGFGLWGVELKADATFVGAVGLLHVPFEAHFTPNVEVGWRLARAYWGRGLATEAAAAVLEHGFLALQLAEIVSFTAATNTRSRRVMEKIGLRRASTGDFDHPRLPSGGALTRHVLYRLPREAWQRTSPLRSTPRWAADQHGCSHERVEQQEPIRDPPGDVEVAPKRPEGERLQT